MALDAASRSGDAVAVVDRGRRISFTELVADARQVTAALLAAGFEPGERAAVWSPNRYEWLVAALGILGAGGAVVPVNTRFKGEEVRYILERSGAGLCSPSASSSVSTTRPRSPACGRSSRTSRPWSGSTREARPTSR